VIWACLDYFQKFARIEGADGIRHRVATRPGGSVFLLLAFDEAII
jgi:hypothetical protein